MKRIYDSRDETRATRVVAKVGRRRFRIPGRDASCVSRSQSEPTGFGGLWTATRSNRVKISKAKPSRGEGVVPSDLQYSAHNIGFYSGARLALIVLSHEIRVRNGARLVFLWRHTSADGGDRLRLLFPTLLVDRNR